ncbi:MAG: hypothetical protein PHF40_00055 [Candidatus Pacebacteria bacterium]|nr:hypothetical protein [Candidatus Paceibacterota bacterium]
MKEGNKGFTLIEMLVVTGVVILLSGILILYSRAGDQVSLILRARTQVIADINRAKNLAITAQGWNGRYTCGYGVYFDPPNNRYIIFTEVVSNCETADHIRRGSEYDVEVIPVPNQFILAASNVSQVFFMPPDPTIFFEPSEINQPDIEQAEIDFYLVNQTNPAFQIFINPIGQVWGM